MATCLTYYSSCTTLTTGCKLYSNPTAYTLVDDGYYSNGSSCFYVTGGTIQSITTCPTPTPTPTVTPTPTPTVTPTPTPTPTPTDAYYYYSAYRSGCSFPSCGASSFPTQYVVRSSVALTGSDWYSDGTWSYEPINGTWPSSTTSGTSYTFDADSATSASTCVNSCLA